MSYTQRQILQGSRIQLIPLEKRHLIKRVEYINDPAVQETLNFDYPTSLAKTEAWFSKNVLAPNRVDFAIEDTDGNIIGFAGYINLDRVTRKAELYIFIGRDFWSGGYGREAYKLLTNYGFIELGLNRVYGYQLDHNIKANNSVKKIGWSIEGFLKEDIYSHGKIKGRSVVAILRSEWETNSTYDEV
ncbi:GNAT family N-acetyltransferase [Kerstersia gyiorum]|uniref:GNAT family N-acetyltransferase n=1 Tax=Kerstersia gyiorum TaxID=206506 RepID=UPI003B43BC26